MAGEALHGFGLKALYSFICPSLGLTYYKFLLYKFFSFFNAKYSFFTMQIFSKSKSYLLDADSPSGLYMRLRMVFPQTILFESNDSSEDGTSKSIIVIDPIEEFIFDKNLNNDFRESLKEFHKKFQIEIISSDVKAHYPDSAVNGIFGYCTYDAVQGMEEITFESKQLDKLTESIPSAYYALFRYVLTFDHRRQFLTITINSDKSDYDFESGILKIKSIAESQLPKTISFYTDSNLDSVLSDQEFIEFVEQCKNHIKRGDVFQIVPSRRFFQKFKGDEFQVYRALRAINPSPYLFFIDLHRFQIFGSSPETFLTVQDNIATLNPIAGTIKQNSNKQELQKEINNLINDKKENSEHVMLVDLARNDLSRHCYPVEVKSYKQVKSYSHVVHLVSEVIGKLNDNGNVIDVFFDCFPAGTVSGAPKYRAMELINIYEPINRNFYAGAVGFFGFNNTTVHALTIRSALSINKTLHLQAGAGVVYDSVPEKENQEVKSKLAALITAIKLAEEKFYE